MNFWRSQQIYLPMSKNAPMLARPQTLPSPDDPSRLSQHLSFDFYKRNMEGMTRAPKESLNNFLKTISEIEDEFVSISQDQENSELALAHHTPGSKIAYIEENY